MSERLSVNLGVILAVIFAIAVIVVAERAVAQTTNCPAGTQPAVASDAAVQNGIIPVGTCYDPNAVGISQNAEQAKAYLNSLPKVTLSSCAPPNQQNIEKLNNTFAVCAAQFLQAYTQKYGPVDITSAFRDGTPGSSPNGGSQSANQCAGGAPNSNHTKGLAMDVHPSNGNYQQMWQFANQNPQYGVCFPHEGQNGNSYPSLDRPHMILAGIGGIEGSECAALGVSKPCTGAPSLSIPAQPATYNNTDGTTEQGSQAVIGGSASSLPAGYCLVSTEPIVAVPCNSTQQAPLTSTTLPTTATTPTTATAAQTTPTSATTPAVSPTITPASAITLATTSSLTPFVTSTQTSSILSSLSTPSNSALLLQQFANPATSSQTAIQTFLSSSPSSSIFVIVQGGLATQSPSTANGLNTTDTTVVGPYGQQTFTNTNSNGLYGSGTTFSPLSQLIANLQVLLNNLLAYL